MKQYAKINQKVASYCCGRVVTGTLVRIETTKNGKVHGVLIQDANGFEASSLLRDLEVLG